MRMSSPWTLGSIQHGGRQEIGILGIKSSVRQCSTRSSPPRRRSTTRNKPSARRTAHAHHRYIGRPPPGHWTWRRSPWFLAPGPSAADVSHPTARCSAESVTTATDYVTMTPLTTSQPPDMRSTMTATNHDGQRHNLVKCVQRWREFGDFLKVRR